jgi:hypothetical protein
VEWERGFSDGAVSGIASHPNELFHHEEHEERQSNRFQNFVLFVFFVVRIKADLPGPPSRPRISAGAPGGLFVSVTRLVREHSFFGAATPPALLPAEFLDPSLLREHLPGLELFNFVQQQPPGEVTIETLLARALALHLDPGRSMEQHHARGCFVDVLPAMPTRSHKSLLDIRLTYSQSGHAPGELLFLF